MSVIEAQTLDHVLEDLVDGLDLTIVVDKLLSKDLISAETHEQVTNLRSNGRTNDAVRITIAAIKRNLPGYLATFIKVLRSERRSEHLGDLIQQEYNTRVESAQREASRDPTQEHTTIVSSTSNDSVEQLSNGCDDDHIIDQYIAAIQQHKDTLFHGQRLLAYHPYLTIAGAVTAKEFRKIEEQHRRNRPKMEAIIELLINERDLQRFIGLSAVMFCYAEADAEEMFPFVVELGGRHPVKGRLTVKKKTSPKHAATMTTAAVTAATMATATMTTAAMATATMTNAVMTTAAMVTATMTTAAMTTATMATATMTTAATAQHKAIPLAMPTPLATPTSSTHPNCAYRLLWIADDFSAVQTVLRDLGQVCLSKPLHTDQITYWEAVLFNEVQLCLTYPEAPDKIAQTCIHMMERFNPNIALLSGKCVVSNRVGNAKLGDIIVSKFAVKISSGADVKDEKYRTQTKQASGRLITSLEVESQKWERNKELYLEHYRIKIPSRSMTYQRLWYTRLYLELNREEADQTGWLGDNGWVQSEGFRGIANRKAMEQQMPKLLDDFKQNRIDKKYWEKGDGKPYPVKPIHSELLSRTERSITIGDTNFPQPDSKDTRVHFASILTTDNNPTADDIDHGNKISNTVLAADLNTFSFYDCVEKYKDCKFFLSVKGVFLMDDGISDLDWSSSEYTEYARLSSASYALQAVKHLYHTV